MTLQGRLMVGTGILVGAGISITATNFAHDDPWLYVGLSICLLACTTLNSGFLLCRSRSLKEEFEAGYRTGFREGRRDAPLAVVNGRNHAGVSQASVRSLAGHR
jgi:hypothetical protein